MQSVQRRLLPRGFELLRSWGCAGAVISWVVSASGSTEQLLKHRRARVCPGQALCLLGGTQGAERMGGTLRCREGLAPC